MQNIIELAKSLHVFVPIVRTSITVITILFISGFILKRIKKLLLKKAKTKRQITNIEVFSKASKYLILIIIILFAIFSYSGNWTGLGLTLGLFSAALGWALQKPITGIAAWIMIVTRRPFEIGDRVIIGSVKGDIVDLTLTHVYLKEIGGLVPSEENSGRTTMVPNSTLFEQNIINYTSQDEYVLDQVTTSITYESNLDKAIKIIQKAAEKNISEFSKKVKTKPYIRTYFQPSSVGVHIRYFAPAQRLQEISSNITKEIYDNLKTQKDVEIAYPHTELVYKGRHTI
jgi:small-conductance mechanosensitive channel